MAQRGSDWNTDDDVAIRSKVSQFSNAQDRMQSLLVKTEGVLPGSVPRIGEQAFVKNRITKMSKNPQTDASNNLDSFDKEKSYPQTGERFDDNQARNRAQLEKLKRQLAEKESNKEKGGSSPSPVGGPFDYTNQTTLASKDVGLSSAAAKAPPPKRTEVQAELLGLIEVRTSLRNLPTESKKRLAQICQTAVANDTPNISEDGLELGPIIATKKSVSVVMEEESVSIMHASLEMARHALTQVGVLVYTSHNKVVVYIGRDAMGRRTAVILEMPGVVVFTNLVAHFKINRKSK